MQAPNRTHHKYKPLNQVNKLILSQNHKAQVNVEQCVLGPRVVHDTNRSSPFNMETHTKLEER